MSPVVGSQYTGLQQKLSLIAQLDSQSKLALPTHENQKLQHQNEIYKASKHASEG
jgi:hypothetical protein